ncbi:hypothetical protein EDD22DRAFT_959903 [Suillus occidentalis]|nr:hypothetical protein EDD22DRAFT_959903 [Suillus occidentalis]
MAPHLHHVPSSTSTQAQAGGKATAMIKDEDEEKSIEVFHGSSADADAFGFDERVKQLANHSGLSAVMIRNVYKHVSNFKPEIEGQEVEELYASDESENDSAGIMSIKN